MTDYWDYYDHGDPSTFFPPDEDNYLYNDIEDNYQAYNEGLMEAEEFDAEEADNEYLDDYEDEDPLDYEWPRDYIPSRGELGGAS